MPVKFNYLFIYLFLSQKAPFNSSFSFWRTDHSKCFVESRELHLPCTGSQIRVTFSAAIKVDFSEAATFARSVSTALPPIITPHTILCIYRNSPVIPACFGHFSPTCWRFWSHAFFYLFIFFLIIFLCSLTLKSSILSLVAPHSPSDLHALYASLPPTAKVVKSWPFSSPAVRPGWGSWTIKLLPCRAIFFFFFPSLS